jgi:hypothetical protein
MDYDEPDLFESEEQEEKEETEKNFFTNRQYRSKKDIKVAVVEYHKINNRAYKVLKIDKRRYKVACVDESCSFKLQFAFKTTFKKPSCFTPHSCAIECVDSAKTWVPHVFTSFYL